MSSTRGNDPQTLLAIVTGILDAQVLAAIEGRTARSALHLVVGILDNLAPRVEQQAALRSLDQEVVGGLLRTLPPRLAGEIPSDTSVDAPAPALRRRVSRALRTLRDRPEMLSDARVSDWLQTCRAGLEQRSDAEIARMRPTRYYTSLSDELG
ncbi:MAG TPA: hypothetical protein VJ870_03430 [Amycolatopsis sp.]|nr:hypothetical protein [Amycolatopsis sp.]